MTINLAGGDNYALISVSLSINKESERYKEATTEILTEQESIVKNTINQVVRQYTKDEFLKNTETVQDEICQSLQKLYGKEYIVNVSFPTQTVQ